MTVTAFSVMNWASAEEQAAAADKQTASQGGGDATANESMDIGNSFDDMEMSSDDTLPF